MYTSPRQKYFKQKLQLRSAYHMILHQNESTKNFSAILAGSMKKKSAQPAWVKHLTQAAWADLYCRIQTAKMAENFFGGFILV